MTIATSTGSLMALFVNKTNKKFHKISLGFASGIMVSALVWSLLIPAIDLSEQNGVASFLPTSIGVVLGVAFLFLLEIIIDKKSNKNQNFTQSKKRSILLFSAVTLHNIPEGMAVGLTFALALKNTPGVTIMSAFILAIGMAFQNIPEGSAISMPLRQEGMKKSKAFLIGTLSGIVEPISAVITILIVGTITAVLPYLLSFAAGAMLFVVVKELLPESHSEGYSNLCVVSFTIGFVLMMILDLALG